MERMYICSMKISTQFFAIIIGCMLGQLIAGRIWKDKPPYVDLPEEWPAITQDTVQAILRNDTLFITFIPKK